MEASDVPMPMPTAPINRLSAPPLNVGFFFAQVPQTHDETYTGRIFCQFEKAGVGGGSHIRLTPAESSVSSRRRVSGGVHTGLGLPQSAENPGLGLSQSAEVKAPNPEP